MSVIEKDDMRGYRIGEEIICVDCLTGKEDAELRQDQIITTADIENEEKSCFCDRCKKRL